MRYSFDTFCLDVDARELRKGDELIELEPQVFRLLLKLIEHRERVLSKDAINELVWSGRPVSDSALTSRIKSLRKALGDNGRAQRLIKTVHGCGYRFVAKVTKHSNQLAQTPPFGAGSQGAEAGTDVEAGTGINEPPTILVLPFTATTAIEALPVLPEGLAHDLIIGLSRLHWLRVISRVSAFRLAQHDADQAGLQAAGWARYSLTGSVELQGKALSLLVELNDLETHSVLWVERISGELNDVHHMRAEITEQAVSVLESRLSFHEAQRARLLPPDNLDAWSSYHLGIDHMYRFNKPDNAKAIAFFERAVKLDPRFARAHAGLSFAQFQHVFNRYGSDTKDIENTTRAALRNAERSVELDGLDPMGNFVMGRSFWLQADPEASLPWLKRALAVNPSFAQGYYAHGLASVMSGHSLGALKDSQQALALSPLDPFLYGFHGIRAFYFIADGDYLQAYEWAVSAARQPGAIPVMDLIAGAASHLAKRNDEATRWIDRARERKTDISIAYLFTALPFCDGSVRRQITEALQASGL
ncbi:MAG: winged helix-turn-helix domain-containing protein [Pseudomonadota bacterium]